MALCLLAGAFLLSLQQAWGKKMPRITRPQVYRGVREMLPRKRFGPDELLRWIEDTQDSNERARRPTPWAAPHYVNPRTSLLEPSL